MPERSNGTGLGPVGLVPSQVQILSSAYLESCIFNVCIDGHSQVDVFGKFCQTIFYVMTPFRAK